MLGIELVKLVRRTDHFKKIVIANKADTCPENIFKQIMMQTAVKLPPDCC